MFNYHLLYFYELLNFWQLPAYFGKLRSDWFSINGYDIESFPTAFEDKVIRETLTNLAPLTYNRYVDDNHTRFKDSQDCFVENRHNQNYLNSIVTENKYQAPKTENTYNNIVKLPWIPLLGP